MGKQKQRCINPEFKNLVRRLKRPPLTTGWHCISELELEKLGAIKNMSFPRTHVQGGIWVTPNWCWILSDPAFQLWANYYQQYKAWCSIK